MSAILCLQVRPSHYSGVLSPCFIFSCKKIANIFAYLKCIVSFCYFMLLTWKWALETIPSNNERLSLVKTKFAIKISTPITNSHKIIRGEFQIRKEVRKLKKNGVSVSQVYTYFSLWYFEHYVFSVATNNKKIL